MNILCLMHAPFEKPGVIMNWAEERGHKFRIIHLYKEEQIIPGEPDPLASSEATTNQAFAFGWHVYAFQFHMEVSDEIIDDFVNILSDEPRPSAYVQQAEVITREKSYFEDNQVYMTNILDQIMQVNGLS